MTTAQTTFRAMGRKQDLPIIADMLGKSFHPGYATSIEQAERAHRTSPYFHPKYTRLAIRGGEIVGHVRIQPNFFALGDARLWVGGVADVATHFAHRKAGVAGELIREAIGFMEQDGFDVSILFGIPDFYHRFGFVPILPPSPVVSVTLDTAERLGQEHRCRKFCRADMPRLISFKQKHDALSTLSVCRTPAHWRYRLPQWADMPIFHDRKGRLAGYARMAPEGDRILVTELVARSDRKVYKSILREAARRAREKVFSRIEFQLPPDHPFTDFCIRLGCRLTATYQGNGGGMGRIIHLGRFVQKMLPEWSRLLSQSELATKGGSLGLSVDGAPLLLRAVRGRVEMAGGAKPVRPVSLTAQEFLQAASGYAGIEALLGRMADEGCRRMAEVLFPRRHPFLWRADGF